MRSRKFLSVLLSVLLLISTCIFIGLLMLRAGNAARIVRNTDIADILENTEIAYYMLNSLNGLPFNEKELSLSDVEKFIKTDAVSNEISGVVRNYTRALTRGDLDYYLSFDEILDIVRKLGPEVNDLFDHEMTEADNVHFAGVINDIMGFDGLSVGGIIEDLGIGTTISFLLFSPYLLIASGIICFAVMFALYCLHKERIANAFLSAGIAILASGIVYLLAGIILGYFPGLLPDPLYRYARFTGGFVSLVMIHAAVVSAVGLFFIMIFAIIRQNNINKRRI